MSGSLAVERTGGVLVATLENAPLALMDHAMVAQLGELAARADSDPTVGAVVLTGAHPTRFLAHFDVREILAGAETAPALPQRAIRGALRAVTAALRLPGVGALLDAGPLSGLAAMARMQATLSAIEACSAVWVVALNGSAGGGGCELALACDMRFMADGPFSISQPEIFLGFPPGAGGTQRLVRLLGVGTATRVCLEGLPLSPAQALELGLVDRVLPPEQLLEEAIAYAARLAARPKGGIGAIKRAIRQGGSLPLADGLRLEAAEFVEAISTPESIAAQRAYVARAEELGDVPLYDPQTIAAMTERGQLT